MARRPRTPKVPEAWELVKAGAPRVPVMHSRTHGTKSRRTERRQARQAARAGGWD